VCIHYEKHRTKNDQENARRHKIEEEIASTIAVGTRVYVESQEEGIQKGSTIKSWKKISPPLLVVHCQCIKNLVILIANLISTSFLILAPFLVGLFCDPLKFLLCMINNIM
jgi:hypothetical protein